MSKSPFKQAAEKLAQVTGLKPKRKGGIPPVEHRFKKGCKGGPGRPKIPPEQKALATYIKAWLAKMVPVLDKDGNHTGEERVRLEQMLATMCVTMPDKVLDRCYGKAADKLELTGAEGEKPIEFVVRLKPEELP